MMRHGRSARALEARRQLWYIALVQVLAMSLWFSASAVREPVSQEWDLSAGGESLLTTSVQLGFVIAAVASTILNLADRVPAHVLMAGCAAAGAALNAMIALFSDGLASAVLLRFLTGMALAGVYPVGMKIMTTWFGQGRGLALGVLVGALTLGSAAPHLVRTASLEWRSILLASSVLALLGAALAAVLVRCDPQQTSAPPFDPGYLVRMMRDRKQRLINIGYLGHMWELYALWAWAPAFVAASLAARPTTAPDPTVVAWLVFASMGMAGTAGCVLAGGWAGRVGAVSVARTALVTSGLCCIASSLLFGAHPVLLTGLLLVWGASVIADSAQFSTALSEAAEPGYVGTALTAQTAAGFALTIVTIQALPLVADLLSWRVTLVFLALGPLVGVLSLSRMPSAVTVDEKPGECAPSM